MLVTRHNRLVHLEAFRGIAALIVLCHHFILAFHPALSGYLPEYRNDQSIVGNVYFVLINGTAAVFFFFVMSGYVLTQKYLQTGDEKSLYSGVLKRWPRLVMPVLISCIASYLLWKTNSYHFIEAGKLADSWWLTTLGFGNIPKSNELHLGKALTESLVVFFNGVSHFNSVLWTMQPELIGSILVMALAYVLRGLLKLQHTFYICLITFLASSHLSSYFYPFLMGLYIAVAKAKYPNLIFSKIISWTLLLSGVYLLGYFEPIKSYDWLQAVASNSTHFRDQMHAIGGSLILISLVFNHSAYTYCTGKIGKLLGELSFPIYLLHTLVIGSFSSWFYLENVTSSASSNIPILFFLTSIVVLISSYSLAKIDSLWVLWISKRFA